MYPLMGPWVASGVGLFWVVHVQVFAWTQAFASLGAVSRSETVGSCWLAFTVLKFLQKLLDFVFTVDVPLHAPAGSV